MPTFLPTAALCAVGLAGAAALVALTTAARGKLGGAAPTAVAAADAPAPPRPMRVSCDAAEPRGSDSPRRAAAKGRTPRAKAASGGGAGHARDVDAPPARAVDSPSRLGRV